jgi:ABC-type transport system involved in cytochrome c biogenesis permease subunit
MGSEEWQDLLDAGRASYADFNRITRSDWETVLPPVCPDLLPAVAKLAKEPGLAASVDRLSEAFSSFMAVGAIEMPSIAVPPGHMVDISTTAPVKPDWDSPWRIHGAWRQRDWAALGTYLKEAQVFGEHLRQTGSPNIDRLELFYNRAYKATIAWAGFALATLVLLAAAIAGKRWLRRLGLAVLWLATLALACGFAARWIISGRAWYLPPIMNTFEAVTASALLAAVAALVMEARWPRNFLAIAAGFYGAGALLACSLWSSQIGADITPAHGILYSPLLAVHVAIIIIGHAMAGMTLVISLIYLVVAVAGWLRPVETVPAELLAFRTGAAGPAQPHAPGLIASHKENAHAGALIVIDKCNLIVAQMAAWAIALGTALGAYWGDRAWGHWWSWDIKETWALVNVLIFIVVLHVRYVVPPRWRGVATAILCIVGCAVMLFNWIAVNYLFHGMHSYA